MRRMTAGPCSLVESQGDNHGKSTAQDQPQGRHRCTQNDATDSWCAQDDRAQVDCTQDHCPPVDRTPRHRAQDRSRAQAGRAPQHGAQIGSSQAGRAQSECNPPQDYAQDDRPRRGGPRHGPQAGGSPLDPS
jgi:hypothetical protein